MGVNLKEGYNGHLTSREAGSVGGQMVKKMIESYEKGLYARFQARQTVKRGRAGRSGLSVPALYGGDGQWPPHGDFCIQKPLLNAMRSGAVCCLYFFGSHRRDQPPLPR